MIQARSASRGACTKELGWEVHEFNTGLVRADTSPVDSHSNVHIERQQWSQCGNALGSATQTSGRSVKMICPLRTKEEVRSPSPLVPSQRTVTGGGRNPAAHADGISLEGSPMAAAPESTDGSESHETTPSDTNSYPTPEPSWARMREPTIRSSLEL